MFETERTLKTMNKEKISNFFDAFSDRGRACHDCSCGKTYYRDGEVCWEEGELEEFEQNPNTISLPHSVGVVYLDNKFFVEDCDCWTEKRDSIIAFLDRHNYSIARYLNTEKERKQEDADHSPVVAED